VKITNISIQAKNKDRVNISVDGAYRFSLDIFQVGELGIRIGKEYTEEELAELESESQFGKFYARALEYTMLRPHSAKEVKDYLWRKTRDRRGKEGNIIKGYSPTLSVRVLEKLQHKKYVDDVIFARWWIETRNQTKGTSLRKLKMELQAKGVDASTIEQAIDSSDRSDDGELQKIITKKRTKYPDEQKLVQYLVRQGFGYDDVRRALTNQ
jgi:regulatory protein